MQSIVRVRKINEVYLKILTEPSIRYELNEYFAFKVPNAHFMPAVKNKIWDGKMRLYNMMTCTLYVGLLYKLQEFCDAREYQIVFENEETFYHNNLTESDFNDFVAGLNLPEGFEIRPYQRALCMDLLRDGRGLGISPTASGKSLIVYLLYRYYGKRTLVVVPTTPLVHQMAGDFAEYGYTGKVSKILDGAKKTDLEDITVSTWQSIYKQPKRWFDQFDNIIVDECHLATAKSLTGIMTHAENTSHRFGLTGTLDDTLTHKLVLQGLFGKIYQHTTTSELMAEGYLANLKIRAILLKHSTESRAYCKGFKYEQEIDYIETKPARNKFIRNLALSLKGNTLVLFQHVEKHGKPLYDEIKAVAGDRPVFFIHGKVDSLDRDEIRKKLEGLDGAILIASYQTFSTGNNTKNLHNIIFASAGRGKIRALQSIGRSLRKTKTKLAATLYDIGDDVSYKKSKNYTLGHFMIRINLYAQEKFDFKLYQVELKD